MGILPSDLVGGGNFSNGAVGPDIEAQIKILTDLGASRCRINVYPGYYLDRGKDWNTPKANGLDLIMKRLHEAKIRPMLLLEYYTHQDFAKLGLGTEAQWREIGRAFATRYRPGGTWAQEQGISDGFGITLYTAFNEPEPTQLRLGGKPGLAPYVAALRGLAEGVHAVDASLQVAPGGFMAANAWKDWTLRGLAPMLAPLFDNGTLAGMDLHTYYDVQWAPMEGRYTCSAQNNFDMVKIASGIKTDIAFLSTEFNFKNRICPPERAAAGLLTGIWDHFAIVGNDGKTLKSTLALPWNLFHTQAKDPQFGMVLTETPYTPTPNGAVLKLVMELCQGTRGVAADPRRTGMIALRGADRTIWVWQNRTAWTDQPGTSITLDGVPAGAKEVEIYGWDGKRATVALKPGKPAVIDGLVPEQTTMFVVRAVGAGDPEALLPARANPRIQLKDIAAKFIQNDVPLPYNLVAQETFDVEGNVFKKWSASADTQLVAVSAEPESGTCAELSFTFDAQHGGSRLLSGPLGGGVAITAGQPVHLRFLVRSSQVRRQVRIRMTDRDGETLVTTPVNASPAWTRVHVRLDADIVKGWGEGTNGKVDFPLRGLAFEVMDWGGPSLAGGEKVWIRDAQIVQTVAPAL